jgi:hypothetical protein
VRNQPPFSVLAYAGLARASPAGLITHAVQLTKSGRSPPEPRPPYAVPHAAPGRGWMRLRPASGRSGLSVGGRCTEAEGSPALREPSSSSPAPTRGTLIWNRRPSRSKSNLISARHWVVISEAAGSSSTQTLSGSGDQPAARRAPPTTTRAYGNHRSLARPTPPPASHEGSKRPHT